MIQLGRDRRRRRGCRDDHDGVRGLIITAAAIVAIARGYFIYRQVEAHKVIAAAGERVRAEQRQRAAAALADKRVHELAVAEARALRAGRRPAPP